MSADEIHGANELMMERQEAEFHTLKRLEGLVTAAEGAFVGAASAKELDPSATTDALNAESEAAENAQVCPAQLKNLSHSCHHSLPGSYSGSLFKRLTLSSISGIAQADDRSGLDAQAAKTAAEATETAAKEAEKAASENDALESTSKAAVAAWRASQVSSFSTMP